MRHAHGTQSPLIGIDFSEMCRQVGKELERDHRENFERRQNEAKAAEERQHVGRHEYYVTVRDVPGGLSVETIEEFPLVGRLSATGRNLPVALTNLRLSYAAALHKKKLLPDFDTARSYAARCVFRTDLGSV